MIHKPSWFTARMKESRNCPSGRKEARPWSDGPAPASALASISASELASSSMAVTQPEECPFCALSATGGDGKGAKGSTPAAGAIGRGERANPSSTEFSARGRSEEEPSLSQLLVSQPSEVGVCSAPRAPPNDSAPS